MSMKIRISKHEYRNKFKSRMTKISNDGVVKISFRALENLDLGIVSDFGFRISNLINDLTEQNKTPPVSSKPVVGRDQFNKGRRRGDFGHSPVSKGKEFHPHLNLSGNRDS